MGSGCQPLTAAQMRMAALAGALLWFAAAMLLRVIGPMGAYEGVNRVLLYVATIPISISFLPIVQRLARLERQQMGVGIAFATAVAAMLDGLALAWAPALYGGEVQYVAGAGAVILWGAGVVVLLGFWRAR